MSNQNFKVGEKVVALTDSKDSQCQPRKAGTVYSVLSVCYCPSCGKQKINIAGGCPYGHLPSQCGCGKERPNDGMWWTDSRLFTRPISNEYKLEVAIPELLTIKEPQLQ